MRRYAMSHGSLAAAHAAMQLLLSAVSTFTFQQIKHSGKIKDFCANADEASAKRPRRSEPQGRYTNGTRCADRAQCAPADVWLLEPLPAFCHAIGGRDKRDDHRGRAATIPERSCA